MQLDFAMADKLNLLKFKSKIIYPPLQKRTASALPEPVETISSTHWLKNLDSFFNEQNPNDIATNANADTNDEPSCMVP